MSGSVSTLIGLRFLRAKNKNSFISFISVSSMLGIAMGILVLVLILSAMNGFERELKERFLSIVPQGELVAYREPIDNWPAMADKALAVPGVIGAAPFVVLNGMLQQGNDLKGLEVRGVLPGRESQVSGITHYVAPDTWTRLQPGRYGIILGQGIVDELGLTVGDTLSVMMPKPQQRGGFKAPASVQFTLIGSFAFGGQLDYSQAYIHLRDAAEIAGIGERVMGLRLTFDDIFAAPALVRQVGYSLDHVLTISDWTRTQGHIYQDIQLVKIITYLVLILVIGVASFNIVSTLVMSVKDKQSAIAILMTMGLSRWRVMKIFMIQGMANASLGCVFGAVTGYLAATNLSAIMGSIESLLGRQFLSGGIYFIDFLPSEFMWRDLVVLVISSLVISFFATLYPAWQAGKVKPALALGGQ